MNEVKLILLEALTKISDSENDEAGNLVLDTFARPWRYDPRTRNVLTADGAIVCRNGDSVYGAPETGELIARLANEDHLRKLRVAMEKIERLPSPTEIDIQKHSATKAEIARLESEVSK